MSAKLESYVVDKHYINILGPDCKHEDQGFKVRNDACHNSYIIKKTFSFKLFTPSNPVLIVEYTMQLFFDF